MAIFDPAESKDPVIRLETDLLRYSPFRSWEIALVQFPNTPHSDVVVAHSLTVDVPEAINYQVIQTNCPQNIYHAPVSVWTHHSIRLRSSVGGGQAIVLLTTSKNNNPKLALFDVSSITSGITIPEPLLEGDMLVARRTSSQSTLQHWLDGMSLIPLRQPRAALGTSKYWFDGLAFEGLGGSSPLTWERLVPGPEQAVLTMVSGLPTWTMPTAAAPSTPLPTPEQPAPVPEAPAPVPSGAVARATALNDRLTYSASTAIRFPNVVTDTNGMLSWTDSPPTGVTAGAFKIPTSGTYAIAVSVQVSDPNDDPAMTLAVIIRKTTAAGVSTDLATSNTITIEEGGTCTANATVYLDAGVFVEAHRSGVLEGNISVVLTTSYMEIRGVG